MPTPQGDDAKEKEEEAATPAAKGTDPKQVGSKGK